MSKPEPPILRTIAKAIAVQNQQLSTIAVAQPGLHPAIARYTKTLLDAFDELRAALAHPVKPQRAPTPAPTKDPDLLCTHEAAAFLRVSPRTLESKRRSGDGPTFIKLGRSHQSKAVYRRDDLQTWLDTNAHPSHRTRKTKRR